MNILARAVWHWTTDASFSTHWIIRKRNGVCSFRAKQWCCLWTAHFSSNMLHINILLGNERRIRTWTWIIGWYLRGPKVSLCLNRGKAFNCQRKHKLYGFDPEKPKETKMQGVWTYGNMLIGCPWCCPSKNIIWLCWFYDSGLSFLSLTIHSKSISFRRHNSYLSWCVWKVKSLLWQLRWMWIKSGKIKQHVYWWQI